MHMSWQIEIKSDGSRGDSYARRDVTSALLAGLKAPKEIVAGNL